MPWSVSRVGREMSKPGYGSSGLDYDMRWDSARKQLVPLERSQKKSATTTGETFLEHIATAVNHDVVDSSLGNDEHQNEEAVATVSNDTTTTVLCTTPTCGTKGLYFMYQPPYT